MKQNFTVTGMSCAACSARVEKAVRSLTGIRQADVNLLAGSLTADYDDTQLTAQAICDAVRAAGYDAELRSAGVHGLQTAAKEKNRSMAHRLFLSVGFLLVLMYFTMGPMIGLPIGKLFRENRLIFACFQLLLTLPVVWLNRAYYKKGLPALFRGGPNMDTLVALGSAAALLYGIYAIIAMAIDPLRQQTLGNQLYFEAAAMILTLVTVGKYLETRAKGKTGEALASLIALAPKTAVIERDGAEVEVPTESLKTGDIIVMRPGGVLPADGILLSETAAIDESTLTGESLPVEKVKGDPVSAATVNRSGYFRFRAEKVGEDTSYAQIVRIVEEAGGSKAPIARLADKVAGIFVPTVLCIAVLAGVIWALLGKPFDFCLNIAISVLVISCPCALGLATPVAITVGTGQGAKHGILFKSAEVLETLHKTDTVVADKTGTLTEGRPLVTDIIPNEIDKNTLLQLAASLEQGSEHPLAGAILQKANDLNCIQKPVEDFQAVPGCGVCGKISGKMFYGGNRPFLEAQGIPVPQTEELANQGKTAMYFGAEGGRFLGTLAVADQARPDAADAISALKARGLSVLILTGDNEQTAAAIAAPLQPDRVIAQVLPQDKAAEIRKLQDAGKTVLMIGDGINDSPALMCADTSMAVGTGTQVAVEAAGIVLMRQKLTDVAAAFDLSKAVIRNIKENLFWAFFYNTLGIPIAAGVLYPAFGILLNPMISAAAMSLSSVFVVTNALRLRKWKPEITEETKMENENKITIKIDGMMCEHCKARVEKALQAVPGVLTVSVDLADKSAAVTGTAALGDLQAAVTEAGYTIL